MLNYQRVFHHLSFHHYIILSSYDLLLLSACFITFHRVISRPWMAKAIKDTPIVEQSLVWAMSASSIPIGIAMSMALDGREGAKMAGLGASEMIPSNSLEILVAYL